MQKKRTWNIFLSIYVHSVKRFMSVCLYVCLSLCLFVFISLCLLVFLSVCLFVFMSFCLFVSLSFCLYVFLSLCLFVFLCLCLFVNGFVQLKNPPLMQNKIWSWSQKRFLLYFWKHFEKIDIFLVRKIFVTIFTYKVAIKRAVAGNFSM